MTKEQWEARKAELRRCREAAHTSRVFWYSSWQGTYRRGMK